MVGLLLEAGTSSSTYFTVRNIIRKTQVDKWTMSDASLDLLNVNDTSFINGGSRALMSLTLYLTSLFINALSNSTLSPLPQSSSAQPPQYSSFPLICLPFPSPSIQMCILPDQSCTCQCSGGLLLRIKCSRL